jgi:hypothetical protein
VRAANVCRLQKNTRDGRRRWAERASTGQRNGRVLIRQTCRRHRLPSFALVSFFLLPSPLTPPLCTERACGLPGTFFLSLLLSFLSFSFSFATRNNDTSGVLYNTSQASTREQDLPKVDARYGSTIRRLIYHTVCWRGQQHEQESREWLFIGAHIYLAGFLFHVLRVEAIC